MESRFSLEMTCTWGSCVPTVDWGFHTSSAYTNRELQWISVFTAGGIERAHFAVPPLMDVILHVLASRCFRGPLIGESRNLHIGSEGLDIDQPRPARDGSASWIAWINCVQLRVHTWSPVTFPPRPLSLF